MSAVEKQYGLIEPKTGKKLTVSDVFNNDSDSGGENEKNWTKKSNQKDEKGLKMQTKLEMQRALQQDPTVYQYDEIYDEMNKKKVEVEQTKINPEKKPKYIHDLMKTAERRKKENERRLERQIQKEREAEGDMYKDKEEFITSSYMQKLEEFKKAEEEDRKMEYIESVMDVSKQQDLGGFYRHLYKETVSNQKDSETKGQSTENEKQEDGYSKKDEKKTGNALQQGRNYRKRTNSSSVEGEEKKIKNESSSSSSDSDSSSDSSSTSTTSEDEGKETVKGNMQSEVKFVSEEGGVKENSENVKKEIEKPMPTQKSIKSGRDDNNKSDVKEDRSRNGSRNGSKNSKYDERDRRDRNHGSGYDRERGSRERRRRDDRTHRNRDRINEHKNRDRGNRNSHSRRRRSRTPENRRGRNKSRERSNERRSRSRRETNQNRDTRVTKTCNSENKKKEEKDIEKQGSKESESLNKNEAEEQAKVSIWEKRTVGAIFQAAVERYHQRKAARGS